MSDPIEGSRPWDRPPPDEAAARARLVARLIRGESVEPPRDVLAELDAGGHRRRRVEPPPQHSADSAWAAYRAESDAIAAENLATLRALLGAGGDLHRAGDAAATAKIAEVIFRQWGITLPRWPSRARVPVAASWVAERAER